MADIFFEILSGRGGLSTGENGKNKRKMHGYPVSLKQINLQRNIERTGHD